MGAVQSTGESASWAEEPPVWLIVVLVIVVGAVAFGISYIAIIGIPEDMNWRKNKLPVEGRTVVVTGASQGMGLELANIFSYKGANVVLVARNSAKLEKAVEYITKVAKFPGKQRFHWISADVTSLQENERMMAEVVAWNNGSPPDVVWANAGAAVPGFFLETPIETLRSMMDVNYWSAVYLARTTLTTWLKSDSKAKSTVRTNEGQAPSRPPPRHFIMTSSTAAFCGLAGYTGYSPTKSALRSLHDQLRSELSMYNGYLSHRKNTTVPKVKVHTVFPGTILTPGLDMENETKPDVLKMLEEGDPAQTSFEVASKCIKRLEGGSSLVVTNFLGSLMRGSSMSGSMRDSNVVDTLYAGLANIVWLFVGPDMDKKVQKWGRDHGVPLHDD